MTSVVSAPSAATAPAGPRFTTTRAPGPGHGDGGSQVRRAGEAEQLFFGRQEEVCQLGALDYCVGEGVYLAEIGVEGDPGAEVVRLGHELRNTGVGVQVAPGRPHPLQDLGPALDFRPPARRPRRHMADKSAVPVEVECHRYPSDGPLNHSEGDRSTPLPGTIRSRPTGTEVVAEQGGHAGDGAGATGLTAELMAPPHEKANESR